jgi:hypothetical protein
MPAARADKSVDIKLSGSSRLGSGDPLVSSRGTQRRPVSDLPFLVNAAECAYVSGMLKNAPGGYRKDSQSVPHTRSPKTRMRFTWVVMSPTDIWLTRAPCGARPNQPRRGQSSPERATSDACLMLDSPGTPQYSSDTFTPSCKEQQLSSLQIDKICSLNYDHQQKAAVGVLVGTNSPGSYTILKD